MPLGPTILWLTGRTSVRYVSTRQGLRRFGQSTDRAQEQNDATDGALASPARLNVTEANATTTASPTPLAGGHLLAAISTSIVGILRDHYGRGPMKAKTYALDDT